MDNPRYSKDIYVVGLVHNSDEVSNQHGAKGLAYSRFFSKTLNPKEEDK